MSQSNAVATSIGFGTFATSFTITLHSCMLNSIPIIMVRCTNNNTNTDSILKLLICVGLAHACPNYGGDAYYSSCVHRGQWDRY